MHMSRFSLPPVLTGANLPPFRLMGSLVQWVLGTPPSSRMDLALAVLKHFLGPSPQAILGPNPQATTDPNPRATLDLAILCLHHMASLSMVSLCLHHIANLCLVIILVPTM